MADSKSPSRNDIQRPRHARLAVLLKKSAAGAAGPNTALLKRLRQPRQEFLMLTRVTSKGQGSRYWREMLPLLLVPTLHYWRDFDGGAEGKSSSCWQEWHPKAKAWETWGVEGRCCRCCWTQHCTTEETSTARRQRREFKRLEVLKGNAATAAGTNTALLKRLRWPRARVPVSLLQ